MRLHTRVCFLALSSLTLASAITFPVEIDGRRSRVNLKESKVSIPEARPWQKLLSTESETLYFDAVREKIVFSGYDKILSSARECWFVTNNSDYDIVSMTVEISYLTPDGRLLHRRDAEIKISIPSGETRMVEVKSFDRQKSFYYYKSQAPRRSATPYDISMRLKSLVVDNNN